MIKIPFLIEARSAIHHGSGMGWGGLIDRCVLRASDGTPYLAGSALKGKFRFAASLVLGAQSGGTPHDGVWGRHCSGPTICVLCRVFGSPRVEGKARFGDAWPVERHLVEGSAEGSEAGIEVRSTTAIDRHRRTARAQHLFVSEAVPSYVVFRFEVEGNLDTEEQDLVMMAANLITHLGGGAARGFGNVMVKRAGA